MAYAKLLTIADETLARTVESTSKRSMWSRPCFGVNVSLRPKPLTIGVRISALASPSWNGAAMSFVP
jgi:hypothetical protein